MPDADELGDIGNRLMNEEMNYDRDNQRDEHQTIFNNLNSDKKLHLIQLRILYIQKKEN
jgi:hypothetical protein